MTWRAYVHDPDVGVPVGVSLGEIAKRLGMSTPSILSTISQRWGEVVGGKIAAHSHPVAVVDGALVVEVDHQSWRTELKWTGGQIADRLNEILDAEVIERLDIRLTRSRKEHL